jgi:hypothetical protein
MPAKRIVWIKLLPVIACGILAFAVVFGVRAGGRLPAATGVHSSTDPVGPTDKHVPPRGGVRPGDSAAPGGSLLVEAPAQNNQERLEAEVITLTPRGIEPSRITRPAGRFLLVVENRSARTKLDVRLSRESGEGLKNIPLSGRRVNWEEVVNLPQGTYVLTDIEHPERTCRITVTRRENN